MVPGSHSHSWPNRFANPVDLNGAAGWLMVNNPVDIEHVCSANVRNYTDRYLPDIYKWVTNEKGILGSQGAYNRRHRRLCQPTFMRPNLLETFSDIITESELDSPHKGADDIMLSDRLLLAVNTFGEVMAQVFVTPMPLLKLMDRVGLPQLKELKWSLDVIQEVRP
eukprot:scaffold226688_cov44-Prasinocladus_malaysianus.AAC.3